MFISEYARDHPDREDIAESFLPYLAVRYRPERLTDAETSRDSDDNTESPESTLMSSDSTCRPTNDAEAIVEAG